MQPRTEVMLWVVGRRGSHLVDTCYLLIDLLRLKEEVSAKMLSNDSGGLLITWFQSGPQSEPTQFDPKPSKLVIAREAPYEPFCSLAVPTSSTHCGSAVSAMRMLYDLAAGWAARLPRRFSKGGQTTRSLQKSTKKKLLNVKIHAYAIITIMTEHQKLFTNFWASSLVECLDQWSTSLL